MERAVVSNAKKLPEGYQKAVFQVFWKGCLSEVRFHRSNLSKRLNCNLDITTHVTTNSRLSKPPIVASSHIQT